MIYRQLPNYSAYEVYADGRIIRRKHTTPKGVHLKRTEICQSLLKNGYKIVSLMNDQGLTKRFYVHRLVWEAFMGEIPPYKEIDHINGMRSGVDENGMDANSIQNLRLVTHKQNVNNPVTLEKLKQSNALYMGKYDKVKMQSAVGKKRHKQLKMLYLRLTKKHGRVGVWMLMKEGHCGYPRACRIVAEMEVKSAINQ